MLNLSIDAANDMEGSIFDPNVNEIESAAELVLEVLMNKNDVFPEHDEPDPESETCLPLLDHIIPASGLINMISIQGVIINNPTVFKSLKYTNPTLSAHLPPPRPGA